ncbi:MAG: hypothetical protein WC133_01005, partial [Candidatus Omnitrophota bacterium]
MKMQKARRIAAIFSIFSLAFSQGLSAGIAANGISTRATTTLGSLVRVTTSAGLVSALNNATGGEEIVLAAGNYAPINFSKKQYSSYVTIRSEDPANRAIFDTINLTNVSYMRFQDVVIHHDRLAT